MLLLQNFEIPPGLRPDLSNSAQLVCLSSFSAAALQQSSPVASQIILKLG